MKLPIWLSPARIANSPLRVTVALLAFLLASLRPCSLPAQTVTFTGATPSVDFGSANLCKPGQTTPAPCSKTLTLDYKVTAGGTLATPKVLTMGAANLDFTLANGTTCAGGVTSGEICAVNVTFAPRFPGTREGGVLIADEHGNVLATTYLYGTGSGPQIGFTSGTLVPNTAIVGQFGQVVIDGEGNLIQTRPYDPSYAYLDKIPANGGPATQIPIAPAVSAISVAIDGAGNLYVLDPGSGLVELPVSGGKGISIPGAFGYVRQGVVFFMSADKFGDVLMFGDNFDQNTPSTEVIVPPGGGTPTVIDSFPADDLYGPVVFLASDPAGNLFTTGGYTGDISEFPAGSTTGTTLPFSFVPAYSELSAAVVDAVGNVYGGEDFPDPNGVVYNLLELPLGRTPQIDVPVPYSTQPSGNFFNNGFTLTVAPNGDFFANGYKLVRSVSSPLNFGSLPIGGKKNIQLGVTNTGNQPLAILPFYESPSYKISESPENCGNSIHPGFTCTLNVQFTALTVGDHTITLTLSSNGTADAVILLEGVGTR